MLYDKFAKKIQRHWKCHITDIRWNCKLDSERYPIARAKGLVRQEDILSSSAWVLISCLEAGEPVHIPRNF